MQTDYAGGLIHIFCMSSSQNFVYQIYSRVKNKTYSTDDFPIQWYHSHADLTGLYIYV